ncbi:hypothetical protein D9756_007769 [Leucocoprinus leucothites]|uniref:Uncharacterized protein n=1 Tax=Leucocoprinus leucothites TaxID=201217 RepID=A0A8H5D4D8_9AGAR|nr:hypothetical protein D9756_007769 [Leucoagaricus leucothites]
MVGTRNISFDDTDTALVYSPGGFWNRGTWNASSTGQSGTLSTSNVLFDANITFTFPQAAVGFYYYGIRRARGASYGICVDCDQNALSFETIDAVNITDDGKNPPVVLYSVHFDSPGAHRIILRNQPDTRFPNNNSQITVDRFEIEVIDPNAPSLVTITASGSPNPTSSSTSTSSSPSANSSSNPNIGAIVGGVIGGLAAILLALSLWYCRWRSKRSVHRDTIGTEGFDPTPAVLPSQSLANPSSTMSEIPTTSTMNAANAKGRHIRGVIQSTHHGSGPSFGSSNWTMPTTSSGLQRAETAQRREIDAGAVNDIDHDTLPPEYDQVFRRASQSTSSSRPVRVPNLANTKP